MLKVMGSKKKSYLLTLLGNKIYSVNDTLFDLPSNYLKRLVNVLHFNGRYSPVCPIYRLEENEPNATKPC